MVDYSTTSEQRGAVLADSEDHDLSVPSGETAQPEVPAGAEVRIGGDNGCPDTLMEPDMQLEDGWADIIQGVLPPDFFVDRF